METTERIENHVTGGAPAKPSKSIAERIRGLNHRVLDFVEAQPTVCVLGALAAGFAFGRLMRDRR